MGLNKLCKLFKGGNSIRKYGTLFIALHYSLEKTVSQTFIRNLIRVDTAVATVSPNNQLLRQKQNLQRSQKHQLLRQQRLRTHCG